jgi:hypothetical protein
LSFVLVTGPCEASDLIDRGQSTGSNELVGAADNSYFYLLRS